MKIKSCLLAILVFLVFAYAVTHTIANKKMNNWIDQNENITVKKSSINLLLGNLSLENITYHDEEYTTDTCSIESIQLRDFSFFNYLLNDEINIDEITINDAQLFLTTPPEKDSTNPNKRNFYVSKVTTGNINLNYSSEKYALQIRQGTTSLTDFTNTNNKQFTDIALSLEGMTYKTKTGTHEFLTEQLELSSIANTIKVNKLAIQPRCSVDKWPTCYPNKKIRIAYTVKNIVGKLNANSISNGIFLDELEIDNGLLDILSYNDMERIPKPMTFFMEKFDRLSMPIDIPVIKVKNHDIQILLKAERADTISFEQIYASFDNVNNIPAKLKNNDNINVATLSKFMDTDLKVDFDFKIKDPLNTYAFKLELDAMPFTNLNKALGYNTMLVIEQGQLQQLDCEVTGNAQGSDGQCAIAFNDLYVTIENVKGAKRNLITKVINLIVKDATGEKNSFETETHNSTLEREETKGFFFHAYTIILQNVKEAIK